MELTCIPNVTENRLYVTLKGCVTVADVDEYLINFNRAFDKLKSGMTVMFDLREALPMEPDAAAAIECNKHRCIDKGMGKFAWVLNSAILNGQMIRGHARTAFGTIEEAIKFLSE